MILKKMFWVIPFIISLAWELNAGGCGVDSPKDFSAIQCQMSGKTKDGLPIQEATLFDIDVQKGTYQCRYGTADGKVVYETKSIPCVPIYPKAAEKTGEIVSGLKKVAPRITHGAPLPSDEHLKKALNVEETRKEVLQKLNEYLAKGLFSTKAPDFSNFESYTDEHKTLSAILIGAFTLDPDFFKKGFTSATGELSLKPEYMYPVGTTTIEKSWFHGTKKTKSTEAKNPIAFMNLQVLGSLYHIGEIIKAVFYKAVILLLVAGGIWSFGYYAYRKTMERYLKNVEPLNVNPAHFASTAILALAFFTAPVIDDGPTSGLIHDIEKKEEHSYSTISQQALRLAVQTGNYFADKVSDGIEYGFANLMAREAGHFGTMESVSASLVGTLQAIRPNEGKLLQAINFYNNVCIPYYDNILNGGGFNNDAFRQKATTIISPDEGKTLERAGIKANRLSYSACSHIENSIASITNIITFQDFDVRRQLAIFEQLDGSKGSGNAIDDFVDMWGYTHRRLGWISTIGEPVVFEFARNSYLLKFDEELETSEMKKYQSYFPSEVKNHVDRVEGDKSASESSEEEDSFLDESLSFIAKAGIWAIMPGFMDLKKAIDEIVFGKAEKKEKDPGFFAKLKNKIMGSISGALKHTAIGVLLGVGGIALSAIIFLLTIFIYSTFVGIVTISLLVSFLAIRVIIFLFGLSIYYLIQPAIGFYYIVVGRNGPAPLAKYSSNVANFAFMPFILVFMASIIVPMVESFRALYSMFIELVMTVLTKGSPMLYDAANLGWADKGRAYVKQFSTMIALDGMIEIVSAVSALILGTAIILFLPGWIKGMIGVEDNTDVMQQVSGEARQGGAGRAINPLS
jgi:hypothetical protein